MKQNQIHQRALSLLLSFTLVFSIFAIDTVGVSAASGDGRTTLWLDSNITITDSGRYVITQQDSGHPVTNTISVTSGAPDIVLENVNINVSGSTDRCAFSLNPGAAVTLTLSGANKLTSGGKCAGLRVPASPDPHTPDASLTITDQSTGSLNATGAGYYNSDTDIGGGAGIGGSNHESGGQITLNGGTVIAQGGENGAGIGGGNGYVSYNANDGTYITNGGDGGNISVTGGTVIAQGGENGAGIGGGFKGVGTGLSETISVSGGTVTANGGSSGAGIGGGRGRAGGSIAINGGNIQANGGLNGAGIGGGGSGGDGGNIVIRGGTVTANGGNCAAGIGGGCYDVTRIGDDRYGDGGNIQISGGMVTATGDFGAGIGGGKCGKGGIVQISGNTKVHAKGQYNGYDIGSGLNGFSSTPSGGTLAVAGTDLNNRPEVELQSTGIDAAKPDDTAHQFTNCKVWGAGAKSASSPDISGCYDANGKIRLGATLSAAPANPVSTVFGSPVTLTAHVARFGFGDKPALSGKFLFLCDGQAIGTPVSLANGAASVDWTPTNAAVHQLTAQYQATSGEVYALHPEDVTPCPYSAGKAALTVKTPPTASQISSGSKLSASKLTGGIATDASGTEVLGTFAWLHPDTVMTASGNYDAVFTPNDPTNYNTASVSVTVTSESHSSDTSVPSLPSGVTDTVSNTQADLSGATMPAGVTNVTLSVTPEVASGAPTTPGTTGGTADPQGAAAFHLAISTPSLNIIGTPVLYNLKLLDQNGSPITGFSGEITVRIPVPAGLHGTPHVFRYEESTGTFTDMNAVVENGFLVFSTEHFSYYTVAGVGDSVTLDTKSYQIPVNGKYQIGLKLTGSKAATVKFHSTNDKTATVAKLKNGNVQVTAKGTGTAYIMIDVYDSKNHLLTHASVKIDVKTGIRPRGDSTRQIGVF